MKTIPLSHPSKQLFLAKVDNSDYEWLMEFSWSANRSPIGLWRAMKRRTDSSPEIYMHRLIMGAIKGQDVDHRDHDGLNNQRYNLRLCSHLQNMGNQVLRTNNKSGFKGVHWVKERRKFKSVIKYNYKATHLGYFDDPRMAAAVYDLAAVEIFKEFALTNAKLGLL